MCGGYSITYDIKKVARHFDVQPPAEQVMPRSRVCPGEKLPIILDKVPEKVSLAQWGFATAWKKSGLIINARKDGLLTKPTFRNIFNTQGCMILVDGFLEWQKIGGSLCYIEYP